MRRNQVKIQDMKNSVQHMGSGMSNVEDSQNLKARLMQQIMKASTTIMKIYPEIPQVQIPFDPAIPLGIFLKELKM